MDITAAAKMDKMVIAVANTVTDRAIRLFPLRHTHHLWAPQERCALPVPQQIYPMLAFAPNAANPCFQVRAAPVTQSFPPVQNSAPIAERLRSECCHFMGLAT